MFFNDTGGNVAPKNAQRETHPRLELGQECGILSHGKLISLHAHYLGHCTTEENDPVFVTLI